MAGIDFAPPMVGAEAPAIAPPQSTDFLDAMNAVQRFQQGRAQTQQIGLQNQQIQQQIADQKILQQYFANAGQTAATPAAGSAGPAPGVPAGSAPVSGSGGPPSSPGAQPGPAGPGAAPGGVPSSPFVGMDLRKLANSGLSGGMLQSLASTQLKYAADYQALTEGQQKINDKNHADAASALTGLYNAPLDSWQASYPGVRDMVRKLAPDDPNLLPDQLPADPKAAQSLLAQHIGYMGAHESLVTNAQKAAETTKALADAAKAEAETPGAAATSGINQNKLAVIQNWSKGIQSNQDTGPQTIHSLLGFNPEAEKDYQALYQTAAKSGDYDRAQAAINAASEYASTHNPESLRQAAQQAGNVARAEVPARVAQAGGEALARLPAEFRTKAANTMQDAQADLTNSTAQSDLVMRAIQMARDGNQVAASKLPGLASAFQSLAFDMKRQPNAQSSSMGSLQDKVANAADSLFKNQPMNWGELDQLPAYISSVKAVAANRYDGIAQSVEQNYGVKGLPRAKDLGYNPGPSTGGVQPSASKAVPPEVQRVLGAKNVEPGIHKLSDGSTWVKKQDGSISHQ
jgi:hypothetical protein